MMMRKSPDTSEAKKGDRATQDVIGTLSLYKPKGYLYKTSPASAHRSYLVKRSPE